MASLTGERDRHANLTPIGHGMTGDRVAAVLPKNDVVWGEWEKRNLDPAPRAARDRKECVGNGLHPPPTTLCFFCCFSFAVHISGKANSVKLRFLLRDVSSLRYSVSSDVTFWNKLN